MSSEPGPTLTTAAATRFRASVLLADYAAADTSGKVNVVGGGWHTTQAQRTPEGKWRVPAQAVVVIMEVPSLRTAELFPVHLELVDAEQVIVEVANGLGGSLKLAIDQEIRAEPTLLVDRASHSIARFVVNFPTGLDPPALGGYRWTVQIDGRSDDSWTAGFFVLDGQRGPALPTIGGLPQPPSS